MSAENDYWAFHSNCPPRLKRVIIQGPLKEVRTVADRNFWNAALERADMEHAAAMEAAHKKLFDPDPYTAFLAAQRVVETQAAVEAARFHLDEAEVAGAAALVALHAFSWRRPSGH